MAISQKIPFIWLFKVFNTFPTDVYVFKMYIALPLFVIFFVLEIRRKQPYIVIALFPAYKVYLNIASSIFTKYIFKSGGNMQ